MKTSAFVRALIERQRPRLRLKERDVAVFNVSGSFGNYQVRIGPIDPKNGERPVEINGTIHHLFFTKNRLKPLPTHEEVCNNMRGTVIMKDVMVHLFDEKGDGHAVRIEHAPIDGAHAKEFINLAGEEGRKRLNEFDAAGRLANETYHIVQEDILKSVKFKA